MYVALFSADWWTLNSCKYLVPVIIPTHTKCGIWCYDNLILNDPSPVISRAYTQSEEMYRRNGKEGSCAWRLWVWTPCTCGGGGPHSRVSQPIQKCRFSNSEYFLFIVCAKEGCHHRAMLKIVDDILVWPKLCSSLFNNWKYESYLSF